MCAPAGPKGALGRHANLFSRVAKSLQPDKEWVESYVRTTDINYQIGADNSAAVMRQFAIITKNGHDIAKIINDTFAYQTKGASSTRSPKLTGPSGARNCTPGRTEAQWKCPSGPAGCGRTTCTPASSSGGRTTPTRSATTKSRAGIDTCSRTGRAPRKVRYSGR